MDTSRALALASDRPRANSVAPSMSTDSPETLLARRREVLLMGGASESDCFVLDDRNMCLWVDDEKGIKSPILLSPKTFAVLKCLVDCAGHLVKQDEFLDRVWPGVFVQPGVLKGQIKKLRTLLGDDPLKPRYVETRARWGYRFVAQVQQVSTPG